MLRASVSVHAGSAVSCGPVNEEVPYGAGTLVRQEAHTRRAAPRDASAQELHNFSGQNSWALNVAASGQ